MSRSCGWCHRPGTIAAALTRCRRHEQCTEEVRAMRAKLYDEPAQKFEVVGTRRRVGAIAAPEGFTTVIIAQSVGDAKTLARDNWRADWQDVLFTRVRPVS